MNGDPVRLYQIMLHLLAMRLNFPSEGVTSKIGPAMHRHTESNVLKVLHKQ